MEEDTKRRFKEEFDETVHDVMVNFGKSEDIARLIVGTVICNTLKKLQIDTDELLFIEFYKKYVHEAKTLSFDDFTVSQLKQIIDETPMSNSDRQIAYKMFIERKTQLDNPLSAVRFNHSAPPRGLKRPLFYWKNFWTKRRKTDILYK